MKLPHRALAMAAAVFALAGSASPAVAQSAQDEHPAFVTQLLASNEVPAKPSLANGYAALLVNHDASQVYYTVVMTDASSEVIASHIHIAPRGQNGGVVVAFCGTSQTPACGQEGIVAEGTFTEADLAGTLKGAAGSDLIDAIRAGNAYVNVHTTKYPDGEVRGQLMDPSAMEQATMQLPLVVE